ncbi:MAG: hypothetical protein AB8H03_13770 [Saprospiraceae bacterium]
MIPRLIILAFLICNYTVINSQSEVKNLDIKIMPSHFDLGIPSNYHTKVERKVIDIFTQRNVVNAKGSTFAIYPSLSIIEFDKMEGIKTLQTAQLEFSLMVKNIFSNENLIVFSKNITGAGSTQKAAINKAISSIRPNQKSYSHFVDELLEKVDSYYNAECETILADAKKAMEINENEKAIALLNTLPKSSDCRKTNENLLTQAFQNYQKQNCNQLIQKANIASLKKNYKNAIDLLGLVDIESSCANEAKIALQKIASANDDQTAKKLAFLNKVYSDNKEIQKARQQSMNAISNTYIEGISKK